MHGVGRLERRDDALELADEPEGLEGLGVGRGHELGPLVVLPRAELRPHARVVQPGRHRVRVGDLAVLVLQDVGAHAVQDALGAAGERGRVSVGVQTVASGLDAEKLDRGVLGEGVEHAHGVGATADAGHDGVWELALELEHLGPSLVADDGLESADNGWEWVGPDGGADNVMGRVELDHPGAHGLVDGVTESLRAGFDGNDLSAKELDAEYVEGLTSYVLLVEC